MQAIDLVVRGGTIADGTGRAVFEADVAIDQGKIVAMGKVSAQGREEIDAKGMLVTPGFVDIHTHYDGQATWTRQMGPNSHHGTTTVVMGNCGVGFAPCRAADRDKLVVLMEGVEDIPGPVMYTGIPWNWETFPQYLNALDQGRYDMDIAAQLPHSALRVYVMGERGANREVATDADIEAMAKLTQEAIAAGALGFSTSRFELHRGSDGAFAPSYQAAHKELVGIARGVKAAGTGVIQLISAFIETDTEFDLMRRLCEASSRPLSFSLVQFDVEPNRWRKVLAHLDKANRDGLPIKAQVCCRPIGVLLGFEVNRNPFSYHPSYVAIAHLPLAERVAMLRQPEVKARILSEAPVNPRWPVFAFDNIFELGDPPNYEPAADQSVEAVARRRGLEPAALAYDMLLERDGRAFLYSPAANYSDRTPNAMATMLRDKNTIWALGDGGAHYSSICDASFPTYLLTHWLGYGGEDAFSLPNIVKGLTSSPARTVGLNDRGVVATGYKGDLNIIDMDRLKLGQPHMVYDLPAGVGRLDQEAHGYVATVVNGEVTYRNAQSMGKYPGRLVRGARGVA